MRNRHLHSSGLKKPSRIAVRVTVLLLLSLCFCACQNNNETVFQGYAEGDFILVASPLAGRLEKLAVRRGDQVENGGPLFSLEHRLEQEAVTIAEQDLRRAESQLGDMQKGQRPSELKSLAARLDKARISLDLSRKELNRRKKLFKERIISQEELDYAQTVHATDQATVNELQAEYATAKLGARSDAIEVARAGLEAARGRLEQARWGLEQKNQYAQQTALVYDTLYQPGEYVPAGYPVVSLLPAKNIKLRFFVPEPLLGTLSLGQKVAVSFDGSSGSLPAEISFISPEVEYTPPMIFSRENRAKLVFMVEAYPEPANAERFHPGQPVDIRLDPQHE